MNRIEQLLLNNEEYVANPPARLSSRPAQKLAVVTCMDARIDVFAALGLNLGDAHIIRNAGARVTDDVLRSLALSSHALGTDSVALIQHTRCGLENTEEALKDVTGADIEFLPIQDHDLAIKNDLEVLSNTSYLNAFHIFAGMVYDVDTGRLSLVQAVDNS